MFPTVTCDIWCDKYKQWSYICFTIHFLDSNLYLHKNSLKTQPFDGSHTGEAIKDLFARVLNEFNLNSNNVIVVSDKGSNMRKAWRLLKIVHLFCIGHGIHSLLMVDCFPHLTGVPDILNKVQEIINKLRYRQHELEQEFNRMNDETRNLFEVINQVGEVLNADLALANDETDDDDQFNDEMEKCNLEMSLTNNQQLLKINYLQKPTASEKSSNSFHTLKKCVLTRWNTVLIMLCSYQSNIVGIETLLRRLNKFDLILTSNENEIVHDLVDFLSAFETTTTTILSASKSYPTMSLCLLLRIEIESILKSTGTESPVIEKLKQLILAKLDARFPVTLLHICGFLLDSSQLKIDIHHYLFQNQTTKEKLLSDMIKKFKINCTSNANGIENIPTLSTYSSTNTSDVPSPRMKRYLSVEFTGESTHNLKKLRENLIQKHTPSPVLSIDSIVAEIDSYLKNAVVCDDVLEFWRVSSDKFCHLKKLAQVVLAIPVTSTPSEQVFSTTGLILNAERTMLAPENVGKIQVIRDNYGIFKKI